VLLVIIGCDVSIIFSQKLFFFGRFYGNECFLLHNMTASFEMWSMYAYLDDLGTQKTRDIKYFKRCNQIVNVFEL
jgi:hypothetical protein